MNMQFLKTTLTLFGLLAATQNSIAAETYRGHGLAMHGDLKYAPGFSHFDYVNPSAPKGGETTRGGFSPLLDYCPVYRSYGDGNCQVRCSQARTCDTRPLPCD